LTESLKGFKTNRNSEIFITCSAGLKCAARRSLDMQDPKNRQTIAIWAPSHANFFFVRLIRRALLAAVFIVWQAIQFQCKQ